MGVKMKKSCKNCKRYKNFVCTLQSAELINYCIYNGLFFFKDENENEEKESEDCGNNKKELEMSIRPKRKKLKLIKFSGYGLVNEDLTEEDFKRKLYNTPFSITTRKLLFEENKNVPENDLTEIIADKDVDTYLLEKQFEKENILNIEDIDEDFK